MSDYGLFVDVQTIQNAFHPADRGIPRFADEYTRTLLRHRPQTRVALSPFQPWPAWLHPALAGSSQLVLNTPAEVRAALAAGPHAYLVMSPFELSRPVHAVIPPHVTESDMPVVTVLYDLIPDVLGVYDNLPSVLPMYRARCDSIRGYDLFLAISEHTRHDAIERLDLDPEKVIVVGAGGSDFFHRHPRRDPAWVVRGTLPAVSKPFVFSVTGYAPHKNTEALIDAWARLPRPFRDAHQLVLTCDIPAEGPTVWTQRAQARGIGDDEIIYTGRVHDTVLRSLYQAATLFVLPSLYEGFGLPVLEAVRCGAPALTSNASSLPEVLDFPPATFPPDDSDTLAALMERAVEDHAFRGELRAAGDRAAAVHTWDNVVERSCDALDRLPAPRRAQRPPRLRIALVGPLSSAPASATGFDVRMIDELATHAHVDCFTESVAEPRAATERRYRRYPSAALGTNFDPAAYDAVVYAIADNADHADAYRLACAYPGVVWLQDPSLVALQLARAWQHGARRAALASLSDFLDRHGYIGASSADPLDPAGYRDAGVLLARELVRAARGCIVSSPEARTALMVDAGALVAIPPVWILRDGILGRAAEVAAELAAIAAEPEPAPRQSDSEAVPA